MLEEKLENAATYPRRGKKKIRNTLESRTLSGKKYLLNELKKKKPSTEQDGHSPPPPKGTETQVFPSSGILFSK